MKSILIDGPSLYFMVKGLGKKQVDYEGLYQILCKNIGSPVKLAHRPVITVRRDPKLDSFARYLGYIGYDVLRYTPDGTSPDDELIKERVRNFGEKTTEIVIVTSDFDFNSPLRVASAQGVEVYWVASDFAIERKSGRKMLSPMITLSDSHLHFVELRNYLEQVSKSLQTTR